MYVLSEALEKFSRLRQILRRQQVFIRAEHAEGRSATAVDKLIHYLEEHCQMFLGNSGRVARLLRDEPLNEAEERAVTHGLRILIVHTLQIHELLLLLPREAAKPQASFLLQDCFGRKDLQASIVLTNLFSAYEYRFEDILEKVNVEQEERMALTQGGNVLCQAFGDKDNPLAWAVLAHEYGHVLDDHDAISKKILQKEATPGQVDDVTRKVEPDFGAAVIAETVADFIAAHVLGPASLMPILFVEMMQPKLRGVRRISAGHPPTPVRVQLVCEYLKQLGVTISDFEPVFEAYKLDYQRKLKDMDKDQRDGLEAMEKEAERLLSPLAKEIARKVSSLGLRRFEERDLRSARTLQQTLASKQPISSRRSRSQEDISAGLSSLKGGEVTPEQVYAVLAGLDEVPVPGSEILSAGWLYRLSSFEDVLMKTFPGETGQNVDLDAYGKYVEKTDGLLLKSLELADVHAEVLRRLSPA
ncbi:MAG: hypothetical protein LAO24_02820 [Acidobacteriia bacterium]|nr:hypothetical protein [Terriglobia bacterium]